MLDDKINAKENERRQWKGGRGCYFGFVEWGQRETAK